MQTRQGRAHEFLFSYLFKRFLPAWLAATLITTIAASIISSQRVMSALNDIGGHISFSDRLSMTGYDLQHFATLYGLFILLAFLIALSVAALLSRQFPSLRLYLSIGAGMVAMVVMLRLMQMVFFGVPIIAGARDGLGLALQALAGGLGGFVFYRLATRRETIQRASS